MSFVILRQTQQKFLILSRLSRIFLQWAICAPSKVQNTDEVHENDMEKLILLIVFELFVKLQFVSQGLRLYHIFKSTLSLIPFPLLHKHCFLARTSGILCSVMC